MHRSLLLFFLSLACTKNKDTRAVELRSADVRSVGLIENEFQPTSNFSDFKRIVALETANVFGCICVQQNAADNSSWVLTIFAGKAEKGWKATLSDAANLAQCLKDKQAHLTDCPESGGK